MVYWTFPSKQASNLGAVGSSEDPCSSIFWVLFLLRDSLKFSGQSKPYLVGALEHGFYFSHHIGNDCGNVIIPTDFHSMIFQRGGPTINGLVEGKIETGKHWKHQADIFHDLASVSRWIFVHFPDGGIRRKSGESIAGCWFQTWFLYVPYMGCHPKPIDELDSYFFKMVETSNQI